MLGTGFGRVIRWSRANRDLQLDAVGNRWRRPSRTGRGLLLCPEAGTQESATETSVRVKVWRERPGVIGPGPCWCALVDGMYLHVHDRLIALLFALITSPRNERCLVGW